MKMIKANLKNNPQNLIKKIILPILTIERYHILNAINPMIFYFVKMMILIINNHIFEQRLMIFF